MSGDSLNRLSLHPVIRVCCYLGFAVALIWGHSDPLLLFSVVLILLLLWWLPAVRSALIWRALLRLRWLFLSIIVLYSWMHPAGIDSAWQGWLSGFFAGLNHCAVLALLAASVVILIETTPLPELVQALYWLSAPLSLLGLQREKLALRLALTIETIAKMREQLLTQARPEVQGLSPFGKLAAYFAHAFRLALSQANQAPLPVVEIPVHSHPPLWQWSVVLILLGLMQLPGWFHAFL